MYWLQKHLLQLQLIKYTYAGYLPKPQKTFYEKKAYDIYFVPFHLSGHRSPAGFST